MAEGLRDHQESNESEVCDDVSAIKKKLSTYLAAVNGTSVDADKLEWWKNHAVQLPFCSTGCRATLCFNLLL